MNTLNKINVAKLFLFFSLLIGLTACGGGSSGDTPTFQTNVVTSNVRIDEVNLIDAELRNNHPDLFFFRNESDYLADLDSLKAASETMTDTEFRLESAKLIASLGDQHSYMIMPESTLRLFPIEIWWIDNTAVVIKTDLAHSALLGQELVSIDGTPVDQFKDVAMKYLAYENEHWKNALSPSYMRYADLLFHEGMIASVSSAEFELVDQTSESHSVVISSVQESVEWMEVEETHETEPLYSQSSEDYWFRFEGDLLYVQYNNCFDTPGYPLSWFLNDLKIGIEQNSPKYIVVDMRFNYGGIIDHFLPVVNYLAGSEYNFPEKLFVLTGRNTFSSAVGTTYSFRDITDATFVGMPTGGKPNGFSHVIGLNLNSGNTLFMSSNYLAVTSEEVESFEPHYLTPFTKENFTLGTDPALQFIEELVQ